MQKNKTINCFPVLKKYLGTLQDMQIKLKDFMMKLNLTMS